MRDREGAALVTKEEFISLSIRGEGRFPSVAAEIPYLSPVAIYPLFASANSFLFESVKGHERIGRYSFIGFDPYMVLQAKDGIMKILCEGRESLFPERPLATLARILDSHLQMPLSGLPPFQGGLAGLLSYDFVHYLERLPQTTFDDLGIPDMHLFVTDHLISFDHQKKSAWAVVCPGVRRDVTCDPAAAYDEAEYALEEIVRRVNSLSATGFAKSSRNIRVQAEIISGTKKEEYVTMVRRAKEYISAGDIFQANLSQRVAAYIGSFEPWNLYRRLREINPSPFAGFADFGEYYIASSSPERLVKVGETVVETRPIAGTRPRGKDPREDEKMRKDLLLNEKERAEHIMLIDLERNDLGKVSEYGSVSVDELMITEDYSHVIHIVSNIRGILAQGKTSLDVIKAVFPGGTITGVPKVRCMEIIDELEPLRRGPYTGSLGYIGFSGSMDMNIIIRTFVIKNEYAYIQTGAGIVADSDPEREYMETLKKAAALVKALGA